MRVINPGRLPRSAQSHLLLLIFHFRQSRHESLDARLPSWFTKRAAAHNKVAPVEGRSQFPILFEYGRSEVRGVQIRLISIGRAGIRSAVFCFLSLCRTHLSCPFYRLYYSRRRRDRLC